MSSKRKIEIFSAECPACEETQALVRRLACPSCEVTVHDMHDPTVAAKAKSYGIHTVPAVVIDGRLATCCTGLGPDEASLRAAGIGVPLP
ncbi:MAG: thioredoxin family protein [Candidatus Binataceae bacterium]|jgi:glutaredoxin|nr:thioredoxin family protein [Candidatus Binataceae bacterium]